MRVSFFSFNHSSFLAHHFSEVFHVTLAISTFLYPSQSHHGPLLRSVTTEETLRGQEHLQDLAAFCINCRSSAPPSPHLRVLISSCQPPDCQEMGERMEENFYVWRKLSGHQRTPHSQNSSITLARLVCLVNLVFSPYDNTVFGQWTAGTAQHLALQSFITTVPLILLLAFFLLCVQC